MLKTLTCVCGEEMELKHINVQKDVTTYWVEAKYTDGSHACLFEGEFDEDKLKSFLDNTEEGKKREKN